MSEPLRIGSLFSGFMGLDMAVEEVFNARTAWVSDIDKGACKILAHRYPDVPNLGDITAIDWASVEPIDILTGGSPCQDLSHAGKRAGMTEGTRSNLWVAMREAIAQLKPTYVIWENVRGAYSAAADSDLEPCAGCVGDASGTHLRALGRVLGDLSELGFDARWHGLRAADVGACHGRYRVFVIATARNATQPTRRGPKQQHLLQAIGSAAELGEPVGPLAERVGDGMKLLKTPTSQLAINGGSQHPDQRKAGGHGPTLADEVEHLLPTPRAEERMQSNSGDNGVALSKAVTLLPTPVASEGLKPSNVMGVERRKATGEVFLTNAIVTLAGLDPSEPDAKPFTDFGQYTAAVNRWAHVLGRPAPAPTEPTGRNGAHRLSAKFVEWMQGCPEGWITDVPDVTRNEALKALGNGVVRQQAVAALRLMLAQERAA